MKDEMSEFEKQIAAINYQESRAVPGLEKALRNRVMQVVDDELTRQEPLALPAASNPFGSVWNWWWAAAAALIVVVLNFSFVTAADDGFSSGPRADQVAKNIAMLRTIESQQEGMFK